MARLTRKQIANAVADSWVDKSINRSKLAQQVSALLVEEGRKNEVDLVVNDVKNILFEKYGIAVADVYSKNKLTETNKGNISDLVESKLDAKKVVINEFIDDSIVGGAMIIAGGTSFDFTINSKLNSLRNLA